MVWVKIDDSLPDHPKLAALGSLAPLAGWQFVCILAYCNRFLTDGHLPIHKAETLVDWTHVGVETGGVPGLVSVGDDVSGKWTCSALAAQGMLEECPEHPDCYLVHDYTDFQPTRAAVILDRSRNARRQTLFRDKEMKAEIRARDQDRCRYCGTIVRWGANRSPIGGTYDHVDPDGPTTPDNLVVACRACNASKGHGPLPLLPVPTEGSGASSGHVTRYNRVSSATPVPGPSNTTLPTGTNVPSGNVAALPVSTSTEITVAATVEAKPKPVKGEIVAITGVPQLVGEFVDRCADVGIEPIPRDKARVGKDCKELLAAGKSAELISEAIGRMVQRGRPVSALVPLVSEVERERAGHGGQPRRLGYVERDFVGKAMDPAVAAVAFGRAGA